jgi:hypothetical protein
MRITKTSLLSGRTNTREIDVTVDQLHQWRDGPAFIQDVMPNLSADDREFLMTGVTPEEWQSAFGRG